ncbi:preprotein translocase subunit SecA [Clostridium grantii]|uniref:Protein translocase subunit SecA n=1 Tax=Clostridium grantii DSM 8605 TaxID=1121316 RepID=A0A1M5RLZ3_9CLOT|nr:preprotein translocase subunit SecA [Clostridium grantii]SHH27068.1 protein translocase subunit secA [Clostridium grantii DSM 8605]
MKILDKVLKDYSKKEIKKLIATAEKIEALDTEMQLLSDEELKNKTLEFKENLKNGKTLDDILVEAFAVAREASYRVLGLKHYQVQLIGGIVLHQGRIAEMKTGEGKTLVATLPAYLNALTGKGVHIITVNDYLAQRDKNQMGAIYEFLGLTTGVVIHDQAPELRSAQYYCDITYGTNSEIGFDYLKDHLVGNRAQKVLRPLNFTIVDEVDSIFIDEARTPLIISGEGSKSKEIYKVADLFAKSLVKDVDFSIEEKTKSVLFTEEGIEKAEKFYNVENYANLENLTIQHHTFQALAANYVMKNTVDYMIVNDEVMIVDTYTGRAMEGRRFSHGLHQAIEAKEGVKIQDENTTMATITYQNFFRLYKKLSGMTGTAVTEEKELKEIYNTDVVVIPTNKPIARVDREDLIYKTELGKFKAIVQDIIETHKTGQPLLVGTVSIEKSELLSTMLKRKRITHQVLNAKYHKKEAEIVAQAGEVGMITIATNMAGRGTDIKLGEEALKLGGLKIIGTERHASRRIDNQLRGRSGRQGDVGESVFYVSLEDEIITRFVGERAEALDKKLKLLEEEALDHKKVRELVEDAQRNVEGEHFFQRKNLIKYDDVINEQRKVIYEQRNVVVDSDSLKDHTLSMFEEIIDTEVEQRIVSEDYIETEVEDCVKFFKDFFGDIKEFTKDEFMKLRKSEIKEKLYDIATKIYKEKEEAFGEQWIAIEKNFTLKFVDNRWIDHMEEMDDLKQYIGYQSMLQKDPVQMYKLQGSQLYMEMLYNIKKDITRYISYIKPFNAK